MSVYISIKEIEEGTDAQEPPKLEPCNISFLETYETDTGATNVWWCETHREEFQTAIGEPKPETCPRAGRPLR